MSQIRLQKVLSGAGVASRRTAETLITQGRVTVNGRAVTALGSKADPSADDIRVDGRRVKGPERLRYVLLNKPRGVVTTRSDPGHRRTVIDLLGGVREYVYPVGRLDYDSEGLLLLTNDGELAARLMHPRHGVEREYRAWVLGLPDDEDLDRLRHGIPLDGRRTQPAAVMLLQAGKGKLAGRAQLSFVIHEGRNRQVRRMCEAVGHPVTALARVRFGPISDRVLKPGQWRDLSTDEVRRLKETIDTKATTITKGTRRRPHK